MIQVWLRTGVIQVWLRTVEVQVWLRTGVVKDRCGLGQV